MTGDLDVWLTDLAAAPTDRSLAGLEAEIGREVAGRRRDARTLTALTPVRLAALSIALAMGVTAGGVAAMAAIRAPFPAGAFAAGAQFAPSTLLEGDA